MSNKNFADTINILEDGKLSVFLKSGEEVYIQPYLVIDTLDGNFTMIIRGVDTNNVKVDTTVSKIDGVDFLGSFSDLEKLLRGLAIKANGISEGVSRVNISKNELGFDAWGHAKSIQDYSILHGMFTNNIPVTTWKEVFNGTERVITNASSIDGKLHLVAGPGMNDDTVLDTFRNPRYQPNRGMLYSSSIILPNPTGNGIRRFGDFTEESGKFFEVTASGIYAVIRTTYGGQTYDDRHLLDVDYIDLSKGNIFDIQGQWRGVGNYYVFINLTLVKTINYLGTRTELTMFNPANPIAFECINLGDNVAIECGCVDVSSEGGKSEKGTYGSIKIDNESGQVAISGFNVPILAFRSKTTVGGKRNTRDTLMLLLTGYSDQRSLMRVWSTRDFTAIDPLDQAWRDHGDGHIEFITYDVPNVVNPMTFDTSKAITAFGSRVNIDESYPTDAIFDGRADIYLTPGDMFIVTMHRENGQNATVGATIEFGEEI